MTRQARSNSRPRVAFKSASTLHLIGDLHYGGLEPRKQSKLVADCATLATPVARLQLGDMTENGTSVQDAGVVALLDQLDGPWRPTVGNHDTWSGRSGDDAGAAWGYGKNYVYDAGIAVVIFVGPDQCPNGTAYVELSATTLLWLDEQLTTYRTRPCLVCCHAPLYDTVQQGFGSTSSDWQIHPRTEIETLLASHAGQKVAWISGHVHTPTTDPGIAVAKTYGSARVLAINSSAIHYVGTTSEFTDPIRTLFLTFTRTGVQVRFRDHGAGVWVPNFENEPYTELSWT
jgi:hypothetical protein